MVAKTRQGLPASNAKWKFSSAGAGLLCNAGRWSQAKTIDDTIYDLEQVDDATQTVSMVLSAVTVEQVLGALRAIGAQVTLMEHSSAGASVSTTQTVSWSLHDSEKMFLGGATVRWMWDDLGQPTAEASKPPTDSFHQWSKLQDLAQCEKDFHDKLDKPDANRPVRVEVWIEKAGGTNISLNTRAPNIGAALQAFTELHTEGDTGNSWVRTCYRGEHFFSTYASCQGDWHPDDSNELLFSLAPRGCTLTFSDQQEGIERKRIPSQNSNKVSHYMWLEGLLKTIVEGRAAKTVKDMDKKQSGTPLFVVAGACPNCFCGMQAVMFARMEQGIDFWWVKPQVSDRNSLERNTLNLHSSGQYKNAAGKSREVYAPLAAKFNGSNDGDYIFGVDEANHAFIEEVNGEDYNKRMLVYMIWQESWSSIMARRKFIQGKILYQRCKPGTSVPHPGAERRFFCRQYRIEGGSITIEYGESEAEVTSMLPPSEFQDMYEML